MIETPEGITVYAARRDGDRWRAVWYEDGERRQCQAASEDRMAARLEKVTLRLAADAHALPGDHRCRRAGRQIQARRSRAHGWSHAGSASRYEALIITPAAARSATGSGR